MTSAGSNSTNYLQLVLNWLHKGYPDGVPATDYYPLLALLSRTLSEPNTWRPSGTWLMPLRTTASGAIPAIVRPRKVISPERGGSRPDIVRSVVVFPAPFAPISATISPSLTWREIPSAPARSRNGSLRW